MKSRRNWVFLSWTCMRDKTFVNFPIHCKLLSHVAKTIQLFKKKWTSHGTIQNEMVQKWDRVYRHLQMDRQFYHTTMYCQRRSIHFVWPVNEIALVTHIINKHVLDILLKITQADSLKNFPVTDSQESSGQYALFF